MDEITASQVTEAHIGSLAENIKWKRICNILALVLMSFGVFVYTFWA